MVDVCGVMVGKVKGWKRSCGLLSCVGVGVGRMAQEEKGRREKTQRTTKGKRKSKT